MTSLQTVATDSGAFLLDDAAQSLGAKQGHTLAGMLGDLGIFSLGRGKALPVGAGGVIVTSNDEISARVREQLDQVPHGSSSVFSSGVKLTAMSVFLNPKLYWIPNSLPFLKLGVSEFDPNFPIEGLSHFAEVMLEQSLPALRSLNAARTRNARALSIAIGSTGSFRIIPPPAECEPTHLRLPVMASTSSQRDRAVAALVSAGVGASRMYPSSIRDLQPARPHLCGNDCPGSEEIAARLMTLPTNPLVEQSDIDCTARVLQQVAEGSHV
jgi:dTDP-4-amino-4,6-dideoxygalactose transaminase